MEQSSPQQHIETLTARLVALDVLASVLDRKQPLDQTLDRHDEFSSLTIRDRAFVRMLTATTLRRLGQIDDLIQSASERSEPPSPPSLHHVLRLAVAQLVFMNVPDHATVDTAVNMAEQVGLGRQKGFVNAVLRRLTRDGQAWVAEQNPATMNIPDWLMRLWTEDYGVATADDIALASLAEAPLDITVKDPDMLSHWQEQLEAVLLPTGTLRRASGGRVEDLPGFDDGMWWIQDAAAALPVQLLGDVTGQHVIDLCAAPGGKTAQLAARGALVTALDRSTTRLKRLKENLQRLRLGKTVTIEVADAAVWKPKEKANFILLDAPCSATGTIRRHPDLPNLKSEQDVARLAEVQERLLSHAVSMLALGGILIYCTCSLQKAEGEEQIESLLKNDAGLRRVPITVEEVGHMEGLVTEQGDIRILPFHLAPHGGMDGFYMARIQKI